MQKPFEEVHPHWGTGLLVKTYMTLTLNSEGALPSEVTKTLSDLGFLATIGQHDYAYDWAKKKPTVAEVIELIDKVHNHLKGKNVQYHVATL